MNSVNLACIKFGDIKKIWKTMLFKAFLEKVRTNPSHANSIAKYKNPAPVHEF